MKKNNINVHFFLVVLVAVGLGSCQKSTPYFSGGNNFYVETLAPEGVKVVGTLWYHNVLNETGDHMAENLKAYIGDFPPLDINYGRDHVITVSERSRYDVPVVFYVPTTYITKDIEEATLVANKKKNVDIPFRVKGHGTLIIGSDPIQMPVDFKKTIKVWDDL